MLRCVSSAVANALLPAAIVTTALTGPSAAQAARLFPATALRGTIEVLQPPEIALNGRSARLSPGSRIRTQDNRLVLSGQLSGQRLVVHYTFETNGLVHDVWILRPEEQARQPWPTTPEEARRWMFDPDAQVWVRR